MRWNAGLLPIHSTMHALHSAMCRTGMLSIQLCVEQAGFPIFPYVTNTPWGNELLKMANFCPIGAKVLIPAVGRSSREARGIIPLNLSALGRIREFCPLPTLLE